MKTRWVRWCGLMSAVGLLGCDPGSLTDSERVGDSQCRVTLESRDSDFTVEMLLRCMGEAHTDCYTIEALTCGGEAVELSEPRAIESCPGEDGWCVDDCVASLRGGNARIWDTPELLEIDACNTYRQP